MVLELFLLLFAKFAKFAKFAICRQYEKPSKRYHRIKSQLGEHVEQKGNRKVTKLFTTLELLRANSESV